MSKFVYNFIEKSIPSKNVPSVSLFEEEISPSLKKKWDIATLFKDGTDVLNDMLKEDDKGDILLSSVDKTVDDDRDKICVFETPLSSQNSGCIIGNRISASVDLNKSISTLSPDQMSLTQSPIFSDRICRIYASSNIDYGLSTSYNALIFLSSDEIVQTISSIPNKKLKRDSSAPIASDASALLQDVIKGSEERELFEVQQESLLSRRTQGVQRRLQNMLGYRNINVRFGTILSWKTFTVKLLDNEELSIGDSCVFVGFDKILLSVCGSFPSVTSILQCTSDLSSLLQWQQKIIQLYGNKWMQTFLSRRADSGINFHEMMEKFLKNLMSTGIISDILYNHIYMLLAYEDNREMIKSIFPFLQTIKRTGWMMTEGCIVNRKLGYCGRFDAVVEIEGEPTLIDWKTVGKLSEKSNGIIDQQQRQNEILQVVAYIYAVNNDSKYSNMPQIKSGAVVYVFEDGRIPEILLIKEADIVKYYELLVRRLHLFWSKVINHDNEEEYVDFMSVSNVLKIGKKISDGC